MSVAISFACAASSMSTVSKPCVSCRKTFREEDVRVVNTISASSTKEASSAALTFRIALFWFQAICRSTRPSMRWSRVTWCAFGPRWDSKYASRAISATARLRFSLHCSISAMIVRFFWIRVSISSPGSTSSPSAGTVLGSADAFVHSTSWRSLCRMKLSASDTNLACRRYSASHRWPSNFLPSEAPILIRSSTRCDVVTGPTASLTIVSAAATRTTSGVYGSPLSWWNCRPMTRSSKLSTAALDGAQTRILGLYTPYVCPRSMPVLLLRLVYKSRTVNPPDAFSSSSSSPSSRADRSL